MDAVLSRPHLLREEHGKARVEAMWRLKATLIRRYIAAAPRERRGGVRGPPRNDSIDDASWLAVTQVSAQA